MDKKIMDIKEIPASYIQDKIDQVNIRRGYYILYLGILFEALLIGFYDLPKMIGHQLTISLGIAYLMIHSTILLMCIYGIFRVRRIRLHKSPIIFKKMSLELFTVFSSFLFLSSIAIINGLDQRISSNITIYIIYLLIIACFILIRPKYTISLMLLAHIVYVIVMIQNQTDQNVLMINLTNGSIALICAMVLSAVFYYNYKEIIVKTYLLEETSKELKKYSVTDPLTGLYNRRYFYDFIEDAIFVEDKQSKLAFLLTDVDSFKIINDTYGHNVGDEMLKYVANTMVSSTDQHHFAVRWGGEEFLLVLEGRTSEEAKTIALQIQKECYQVYSQLLNQSIPVTISVGIATAEYFDYREIDKIISQADQALYQAKFNGKNQVVVFETDLDELSQI